MSTSTIIKCPSCKHAMTVLKPMMQAGQKLRCPTCKSIFGMHAKKNSPPPSSSSDAVSKVPAQQVAQPASPQPPAMRAAIPPISRPESGKKNPLLLAVGVLIVLAGAVVALVYLKPGAQKIDQQSAGLNHANKTKSASPKTKSASPKKKLPAPDPNKVKPDPPAKKEPLNPPLPKKEPVNPKPKKPVQKPEPPKPMPMPPIKKDPGNPPPVNPKDPGPKNPKPKPKIDGPRFKLTNAEQKKVNSAIDRGVAYLIKNQADNGGWRKLENSQYIIGYAALPGMTLLECGVPSHDAVIQRAAAFVRRNVLRETKTYNISLAILFLDRLGDPRDRPLIQTLALRLIYSQTSRGGWRYDCALLSQQQLAGVYTTLLKYRRKGNRLDPLEELFAKPLPKQKEPSELAKNWAKLKVLPYPALPPSLVLSQAASKKLAASYFKAGTKVEKLPDWGTQVIPNLRLTLDSIQAEPAGEKRAKLLVDLRNRKGFRFANINAGVIPEPGDIKGDNSNTQFAMLGLWAARRHGVPTEHALRLSAIRFFTFQNNDGGWSYDHSARMSTGSMTGVGLLGLAMGYGVSDKDKDAGAPKNKRGQDPAIQNGIDTLARYLGGNGLQPASLGGRPDLYFIWTVERVAVLYNLQTLAGTDWYRWGSKILLPSQGQAGSWYLRGFVGSTGTVDTCFALLFLKRSNLVEDLTEDLRFHKLIERK